MKRRELKILWNSNGAHTNSGYGVETRDLLFRFNRDGWLSECISFWGVQGYPITIYGQDLIDDRFKDVKLKQYPSMDHPMGSDAMVAHGADSKANVIFSMQDIGHLDPNHLNQIKYWIPYVPIDKDPVPPIVLDRLKYAYKIITFSRFGQQTLEKAGFTSTLILEGTDPEIMKPMNKKQMRKEFGLPEDAYIFGMVAANKENPPRKGFQEAMEAFAIFATKHPESRLLLHTQQRAPGGFPVEDFATHLKIADKVLYIHPYQAVFNSDSHTIAKEMNCFDALLHPSMTEGFGLTCIEAMSCGVPVLVNNTTSMPEMVVDGVTGVIVDAQKVGRFTNDSSFVYPADVQSLYEGMEKVYAMNSKKTAKSCRNHILKNYDINKIVEEKWIPLLEELQKEILPLQEEIKEVK